MKGVLTILLLLYAALVMLPSVSLVKMAKYQVSKSVEESSDSEEKADEKEKELKEFCQVIETVIAITKDAVIIQPSQYLVQLPQTHIGIEIPPPNGII